MARMSSAARARVGRPRALPAETDSSPRDQILDAAAALFVDNGFAGTTTRAIAERVGIRQASMYYHFAGKDDILLELLRRTVRPTLDVLGELDTLDPAASLYALVVRDVETLVRAPHNIGTLYLLPEVAHERFEEFWADRTELRSAYSRLGTATATDEVRAALTPDQLGMLLIHTAESVISARRDGVAYDGEQIAAACLRLCGLGADDIAAAATVAD